MGASISIMALQYKPNIRFCISDCGYGNLKNVVKNKLKRKLIPSYLGDLSSKFSKKIFGYDFIKVKPIECLKNNTVPICFIHGKKDTFTPYSESVFMYNACTCYKSLHLFENANHAQSLKTDTILYKKILKEFLQNIEILEQPKKAL